MCTYNAISSHTDLFIIQKRDSEESLLNFVNLFPIFSTLKNCLLVIKINMCFFNELTWMGLKK